MRYWPAEGSILFGDYNVELKRDTLYETFSLRDLLLTFSSVSYTYCKESPEAACVECIFNASENPTADKSKS